jgi:predicted 2-oxoglutarate/Fe(II)-dependent dioxygenase YbiX
VPDSDRIYFHRDGYDRLQFDPHEQNQFNATSWWLPVASGDLVIFPSSLTHHVAPVQADTTRVSLAINTWFNGTAGSSDTLTELSCKVAAPFA